MSAFTILMIFVAVPIALTVWAAYAVDDHHHHFH